MSQIERGTLELELDGQTMTLHAGDAIYYTGDRWHGFANPDLDEPLIYYLAMDVQGHEADESHAGTDSPLAAGNPEPMHR